MEGVVGAGGADGVDCDGVKWGDGMGVVTAMGWVWRQGLQAQEYCGRTTPAPPASLPSGRNPAAVL